jgi:cytochrome P450
MWTRFPPRMRRAISAALEEAGRRGCEEASPEHLLLSIAADPESAAAFMFEDARIARQRIVEAMQRAASSRRAPIQRAARFSPEAMHLLDIAVDQADRREDLHVGTEHVALALCMVNGSAAADTVRSLGFTRDKADAALRRWIARGMPRRRGRLDSIIPRSKALRAILAPVQKLARLPTLAWKVYVRKSLGHPRFVTDPYPLYCKLREAMPVRQDPLAPVWVLTRYADIARVLRDPRFRKDPFALERLPSSVREQLAIPPEASPRTFIETVSMLFLDPPEHTRIRGIFTKAFTPKRLESLRPRMQQITDKRLDLAASRGSIDVIADLAVPLPICVICELLGFPPEDYPKIKKWSDDFAAALALNPGPAEQVRAAESRDELRKYFEPIATQLRREPRDNLLSALLQDDTLTPNELFANSTLLVAAGHETTTHLIGNGVLALLRHPDQLDELRRHPELIESAVEELLRFDCPVQWTSRVASEPIELGGQTIERDAIVLASLGAANRDPAQFPDPDRLDIRRKDNRHLSFGAGIHFCLGAALARMEAQIAIGTLVQRFPRLKLATSRLKWQKGLTFRGVKSLLIYVDGAR